MGVGENTMAEEIKSSFEHHHSNIKIQPLGGLL